MVTGYVIVNEKDDTVYTDEGEWASLFGEDGEFATIASKLYTTEGQAVDEKNELYQKNYNPWNVPKYVVLDVRQETPGGPFQLL